jgi:hypothetical protein
VVLVGREDDVAPAGLALTVRAEELRPRQAERRHDVVVLAADEAPEHGRIVLAAHEAEARLLVVVRRTPSRSVMSVLDGGTAPVGLEGIDQDVEAAHDPSHLRSCSYARAWMRSGSRRNRRNRQAGGIGSTDQVRRIGAARHGGRECSCISQPREWHHGDAVPIGV